MDPQERLELARGHLSRVQAAWLDPTDWSDLSIYGLHAGENAAMAAADKVGIPWKKTHWDKANIARQRHNDHGLPDVADLLNELNDLRKGFAYGESTGAASMRAEEIALRLEAYVEAVATFLIDGETDDGG